MNTNRKIGRPMKYETREQLEKRINKYFEEVSEEEITITGLCLYLGINKDTFYEYAKRDEFRETINLARLIVENSYELSLRRNGRTGDIFALKNFGWQDKMDIETKQEDGILKDLVEAMKDAKKD